MLRPVLTAALAELVEGRPAVLAAIVRAEGSVPRGMGAVMVVGQAGVLAGTIGGGALEHQCAGAALTAERPLAEFALNNDQAAGLGMVCGGRVQVLFTRLTDPAVLRDALTRAQTMQPGWLALPFDGGAPVLLAASALDAPAGRPAEGTHQGGRVLALPLAGAGRVYLFGGGHVALALAGMLDLLGYPYLVVDDRPEFASPARFPGAVRALTADLTQLSDVLKGRLAPAQQDALCVMTRGHLADTEVLRFALGTPAGYIGLMGSRSKRARLFAQLDAEGFSDAPERVMTPIGLPIGGQTPAEVAVSIAAQLVQFRCGK